MGGWLGIGNSSAKTDRGNQLAGINAAWSVYNRGLPLGDEFSSFGKATTGEGLEAVDSSQTGLEEAKKFWQDIMQGGKTDVAAAVSPEVNAINEIDEAARAEQATMGTGRGGGVAESNAMADTRRRTAIGKAYLESRPVAAKQLQDVATTEANVGFGEAQVGNQQIAQALSALGLSKEVADEIINSSIASRPISMKANAEVRQMWSNALAALGL